MRKMNTLPASKKIRIEAMLVLQRPDELAERKQFGALTSAKTLHDAAVIHCRYLFASKPIWDKAFEMRDNIIAELDWKWPHVAFWEEVENIAPQ